MPRPFRALFTIAAFLILGLAARAQTQTSPDGPFRVGGGVTRPELISQGAKPAYTEAARRARLQGVVILEAIIDERGEVTNVRVLKGLPMGLDQSAVDAVQTWKFKPATFEGKPVKVYYVLTVNFYIDGPAYQGPAFLQFLREHDEFAGLLRDKRFAEAAALLDAMPKGQGDPIGLARIYLLLEQDLFDNAWRVARPYDGAHRSEALRAVASYAFARSQRRDLDSGARFDAVELGLEVATQALEAEPDEVDFILIKSSLLREKAAQTNDDGEASKLRGEADQLEARAREVKARQAAERGGAPRQ